MDELVLVREQRFGAVFEPDVVLEVGREGVAVGVPPPAVGCLAAQGQQRGSRIAADLVEVKQAFQVGLAYPDEQQRRPLRKPKAESRKPDGMFTVYAEIRRGDYVRIEVRDDGGPWDEHPHADGRPHGLAIVRELAADSTR